jgi:hypothetical protein
MHTYFHWLESLLKDIDGFPSSKRAITFLFMLLMMVLSIANTFFGVKLESFVVESVRDIIIAGIGFSGLEKFTSRPLDGIKPTGFK